MWLVLAIVGVGLVLVIYAVRKSRSRAASQGARSDVGYSNGDGGPSGDHSDPDCGDSGDSGGDGGGGDSGGD